MCPYSCVCLLTEDCKYTFVSVFLHKNVVKLYILPQYTRASGSIAIVSCLSVRPSVRDFADL